MDEENFTLGIDLGVGGENGTLSPADADNGAAAEGGGGAGDNMLRHSMTMVVVLSTAYVIVFVLAVVNNILIVTVIYRNPQLRTVTNYFVANLAIADITVSFIVLPVTLVTNLFTEWQFGLFLCRAIPYLQAVAVSASVNTLAAVALERYFAIFYPQRNIIRPNIAAVVIAVIWFVPMCIQVPWALYYTSGSYPGYADLTFCWPTWTKQFEKGFFLGIVFLTCYLIPLCFMCVCYSLIGIRVWRRHVAGIRGSQTEQNIQKSKIRVVRMLISLTVIFTFSWLPLYTLNMWKLFGPPLTSDQIKVISKIQPFVQWLGSTNSAINPFIYCYFSKLFRRSIITLCKNICCWSKFTRVYESTENGTQTEHKTVVTEI